MDPEDQVLAPSADDVGRIYGDTLSDSEDQALEARMRARAMALQPPQPAGETGGKPPRETTPDGDELFPIEEGQSGWSFLGGDREQAPLWEQTGLWLTAQIWGGLERDPEAAKAMTGKGPEELPWVKARKDGRMDTIDAVASDIGASDPLMAIGRGVRGAVVNAPGSTATLLTGVGNKGVELFNDYLNAPFLDFIGAKGSADLARQWSTEARARQADAERQAMEVTRTIDAVTPSLGKAETNTEALIEGVSQFIAGFVASKKLVPGKIGPNAVTDVVARGAAVNTVAFDPKAPTLANLVGDLFPDLKDTWITATAITETDTGFEAQMKRAIEGIGLDAAVEGILMAAGRFLRSARKADAAQAEGPEAVAEEVRKTADTAAEAERAVASLGDPAAPDISEAPPAPAKMYQGETTPQEQAARVESAVRRANVLDNTRQELSIEEIEAAYGGGRTYTADQVLDMMDTVRAGARPRPLLTFVRANGGIRDGETFAGEVAAIEAPRLLNRTSPFDIDQMAAKAAEAGYIPYDQFGRHDVNDFIDALKRDQAAEVAEDLTRRVYSSADAEIAAKLPDLLRLERELSDLGVNPRMRGPVKRKQAAEEAARRYSAAAFGGETRSLDDLDALQRDMDAAGVTGFRPYADDMLDADPTRDAEGLLNPQAMNDLSPEEMAAVVDQLTDSDAFSSALSYLDFEAPSAEAARAALLRNALEMQRRGRGSSPVSPEERDAVLSFVDEGEAGADDVTARMAALRERMADPGVGADNNATDLQPGPSQPQWQTPEGRRAFAERALRMGSDKALPFVDQAIAFATDAEHRAALQQIRELVENTLAAKFSDSADDAMGRARRSLQPTRPLRDREQDLLQQLTAAAGRGVDPLRHLETLGVKPDVAREVLAHALQAGELGPWAAARAALAFRPGGMLDGHQIGRIPIEASDDLIVQASEQLSPQEFEAWKLAALEGVSNRAISEAMGGADATISPDLVKVVLSHVRRKGFEVPTPGRRRGPDAKTQRVIDLIARDLPNSEIAERLYPGQPTQRAANTVAVLKKRWAPEVEARRQELFGSGGKFSDSDPSGFGDPRFAARSAAVQRMESQGVDFFGGKDFRDELARLGLSPREIGRASVWRNVMEAGGDVQDVLDIAQVSERTLRSQLRQVAARLELAESSFDLPRRDLLASDAPPARGAGRGREQVETVAGEIRKAFGRDGEALLRSGAVVIHPSADSVPFTVPRETTTAAELRGTIHIIADRITPQQVYGIMLHEVGVHAGMREMLGKPVYDAIVKSLRDGAEVRIGRNGVPVPHNRAANQAFNRIPLSTLDSRAPNAASTIDEELLAYYVQHAPAEAPLLRRVTAGIAAWMYRTFPAITKVLRPSQEALRQLAVRSLRRYARQTMDRPWALGGDNDHIGFYSAVERTLARIDGETVGGAELMRQLREAPGVREAELQDLGLDAAIGSKRSIALADVRRIVAERRLYMDRKISVVRPDKAALPGARDVRDVVYRLPSDTPGGAYSRSGGEPGRISVARISSRKTTDGREVMQIESLDSDIHPQNGYAYLRPEIIDQDIAARQEQLWAAMDGARRPIDALEQAGANLAGSLPEYRAWRSARQDLLNDIAENGDHVGYTAASFGIDLPPPDAPLRQWAQATLRNLLASAAVTEADGLAIPVSRMFKDANPGQQQFVDVELKQALEAAARELDLEIGAATVRAGGKKTIEVPAIWLNETDRARLAQSGVPLYSDAAGARSGAEEPANNLRVRAPGGRTIYVNLARIAADGDIKTTIQKLADRYADEVNAARGGERQADTDLLASSAAVDAWETLRTRRVGEPLGAKESIAARQLWAASAEWLTRIADRYRSSQSLTDKFAFNQALAVHRAIQAEVIGARTETARALRSWRIPVGSTPEKLEQISGLMVTHGAANIDELAGRLARLGEDQIGVLDDVVEKSFRAKTADVLGEIWRASLLSNPKTHIVNLLSNTSVIALDLAETAIAGAVSRLPRWLGGNPETADMIAEAAAKYDGVQAAFRAQLKFFHENGRFNPTGEPTVSIGPGVVGHQTDTPRANAVSAESFGLKPETLGGTTADVVGSVLNTPQALLGGADDFFKGINYQGELFAQAHRIAAAELRGGTLDRAGAAARMADLVASPSEAMQVAARRAAHERTFTTPPKQGGIVSSVFKVREWLNSAGLPIGHFILPFINTPANIMKWTFSRTPAGLLMADMQRKLRAGGKDAMMAKVQIAMGTMGLGLGWQLAASGVITGGGPVDPGERQALQRSGWQPYSVRLPDGTSIAFQRFDPIATFLSIAADLHEIQSNLADGDGAVEQAGEATALALGAIGNAFLSKTYLQGVSDFNAFIADPQRYGERYISNIVGSFGGPAGIAEIRRQADPAMRDVTDVIDAIKNRWPGASQDLPPARDLWGRVRTYQSHLGVVYDALSPFIARKADPTPVDAEMLRLGYYPQMPNRSISVPIAGRSVIVPLRNRPDIYNRMLELSGGRALEMANQLVQSPAYKNLLDGPEPSPGTKAFAIETVIQRNREVGRLMTMQEFWGDLQEMARKELSRELEPAAP